MRQNNLESLYLAIREGDIASVQTLLDQDASLVQHRCDYFGTTPLHAAAAENQVAIAALLIEKGADVNVEDNDGDTPFNTALIYHKAGVANLFIEKYPHTIQTDVPLLHTAVRFGCIETVKLLLAHPIMGTDTDDAFSEEEDLPRKDQALHIAVEYGHETIVKLLLHNGVSANSASTKKITPLHRAAARGRLDIVILLIQEGADVNAMDIHGNTPLGMAEEYAGRDSAFTSNSPHLPAGYNVYGQYDTSEIIPILHNAKRIRQEYQAVTLLRWIRLTSTMKKDGDKEASLALLPQDMILYMNEVIGPELTPETRNRVCAFGEDKATLHKEMTKQRFFNFVFPDDKPSANHNNNEAMPPQFISTNVL